MSYHYYQEEINSLPANDPDGFGLSIQIRHEGTGAHTKWLSLTEECKDVLLAFLLKNKMADPDGMTDAVSAIHWRMEFRKLQAQEEVARKELAETLIKSGFCQICPATWKHIINQVTELTKSWRLRR